MSSGTNNILMWHVSEFWSANENVLEFFKGVCVAFEINRGAYYTFYCTIHITYLFIRMSMSFTYIFIACNFLFLIVLVNEKTCVCVCVYVYCTYKAKKRQVFDDCSTQKRKEFDFLLKFLYKRLQSRRFFILKGLLIIFWSLFDDWC